MLLSIAWLKKSFLLTSSASIPSFRITGSGSQKTIRSLSGVRTTSLRSIPRLAVYRYRMVVVPTVPKIITLVFASRTPSSSTVVTSSRWLDSSFCSRILLCVLISPVISGRII